MAWLDGSGRERERESAAAAAAAQAIPCNHRHARSAARFLAFNLLLYLWTQKMTTPLAGWLPHRQHPPPAFSLREILPHATVMTAFFWRTARELAFVFARHPYGGGTLILRRLSLPSDGGQRELEIERAFFGRMRKVNEQKMR